MHNGVYGLFLHPDHDPMDLEGIYDECDLDKEVIDPEHRLDDWPTIMQMQRMDGNGDPDFAVSAEGLFVYRAMNETPEMEVARLDPGAFSRGLDFMPVLSEAAHCALDEEDPDAVEPLLRGLEEGLNRVQASQNSLITYAGLRGSIQEADLADLLSPLVRIGTNESLGRYVMANMEWGKRGSRETAERFREVAELISSTPPYTVSDNRGVTPDQGQTLLELVHLGWVSMQLPLADMPRYYHADYEH